MDTEMAFLRTRGRVPAAILMVALLSLCVAQAAGLALTSGGVVLKTRTYGSPVTCTLTAVADTYVNEGQPNSSFGSQTSLQISSSSSEARRVLVSFDLTSCSPQIAADAIVHSATVRLTTASGMGLSSRSYELHRATSSWTESTTWSTQPSVAASATSTVSIPGLTGSGTTIQWPAARDVQAFIAGDNPNLGWRLKDTSENVGFLPPSISFSSREAASNRPQLVITYAP
jgi:hypothetical protein